MECPDEPFVRARSRLRRDSDSRCAGATGSCSVTSTTYIFAGGGTGGHIYPALAIWDELVEIDPGCRCVVACSDRPLDARILEAEGRDFEVIPAKPLGLKPRALWRFVGSWGPSVRAGRRLIADSRSGGARVVVVAMGGFVAAPLVQSARAERVPIMLVNLDAVPGKANRWIARHADQTLAVCGCTGADSGWSTIPPIVRRKAVASETAGVCRASFDLDPSTRTLLVTGGSQGAGTINHLLRTLASHPQKPLEGWQVLHQCGERDLESVRKAYEGAGVRATVRAFLTDMGRAYGAASLSIGRSGAGSVAEIWANRLPAIFLPYPYHRDQHQRFNAQPLVECGGARVVDDLLDPEKTLAGAGSGLISLLKRDVLVDEMRRAMDSLGPADGANLVARALVELPFSM